jgi:hypothetical protein
MPESFELRPGQTISVGSLRVTLQERAQIKGDERVPQPRAQPSQVVLECPIYDGEGEGGAYHVRMAQRLFQRLGAPLCPYCKQRLKPREV